MNRPWYAYYPKGVPHQIEFPSMSIYDLLARSAHDFPYHIAVIDRDQEITYAELKNAADRFASALHQLGFRKGDRIAIMLSNSKEFIISYYGIHRLGGIFVPVNPMYQALEVEYILRDSGAECLITTGEQKQKLQRIGYDAKLTLIFTDDCLNSNEHAFYDLIANSSVELPPVKVEPQSDIAVLQYTGGTTGKPKGVMLTHFNIVSNIHQSFIFSAGEFQRPGERILCASPFFHVYGMTSAMNVAIFGAAAIICLARFEVKHALELIRKYRPTFFPGVPTMYIALLNHSDESVRFLNCIKVCNSGSAPMPVEVMNEFEQKTGAKIVEGYGLSEASPVTHRNPIRGKRKPGSIGIPLPNTDCKIVDLDTGTIELPPGEPGELIVKGPQVMKGYWNKPEETAETLRDGWLYTGDIAKMDDEGFFYIVGRKKEMIIAGGYNIYPIEVEEVIYQHPGVAEACVFGVPDPYRGETVKAVIVPKRGVDIAAEEIINWCNERLARYKVPRLVEFRDQLPKSAVGKILRRKLAAETGKQEEKE